MDFFAMKRKELQALCKQHGIRANLKNSEMAQRLTLLLNEDAKFLSDVELAEKQLEATEMVTDSVESPKAKKVKFSPNNETFYFVATDKDSDSDCDYSPKNKSRGKKEAPGGRKSAREDEAVEVKDTAVRVMRSQKQKVVAGAVESVSLPGQVMNGFEKVDGKGVKRVKVQKECNAIVLHKGKVVERDDARKRVKNKNSEGASQLVPTVEASVGNEVLSPKPLLRRSKRKTTLSSSVAGAEKELGICGAVENLELGREPVGRKDAAKPGRRSNRIACKKVSAETSDDMTATAVEIDGLIKENQEPLLLEESSLVVYESLARSTVRQIGKELQRDVAKKRPRNKDIGGNSKSEPCCKNEVLPPRRSNRKTALVAELSRPAEMNSSTEKQKIEVGLEVQECAGNGNETDSCLNKEAVEKSRKKRKGSRKKINSATKDQPVSLAVSTVYSEFEKSTDILAHRNKNQLVESVNFQENMVKQSPLASPDNLVNVVVSSNFACVGDVGSITYGPECEGQTSNLLDLNGGPETEESIVNSISRKDGVLDDQLENGVIGTIGEMHLDGTVPRDTTLTPYSSVVKQADGDAQNSPTFGVSYTNVELELADGDAQNSPTFGVSYTNVELELGVVEQDVDENFDGHVEIMHSKNAMDAGDGKEIFEKRDQHADQSILEASRDSISRDDKTAERIAYACKMGEDSSSKDIQVGENRSFLICYDGHTHRNDAAAINSPRGREVSEKNTVDDEMVEKKLIRSKSDGWKDPERKNMHMLVSDIDSMDSFGMLDDISHEKVDEGHDTGIYRSEEETHTLHSKETEEVPDPHNFGTSVTCSADSIESSMLKPEMGVDFPTDSPVTASDLENKALELEAASPIWNNSEMNRGFRDGQTSELKILGPEMSKANIESEYIEDVKNVKECDDTYEENPIASPCKLSSMMVSSNIACVRDVRSFTYQPDCEDQNSNLEDLKEGSKTEDSVIVKSISQRGAVLDDQLASIIIGGVSQDQNLIDQIVMVQVDMDPKKPNEAVAVAVGENQLDRTVSSVTALTPLDSSPVDQVGNEFQADCALAGGINMNFGTKLSPTSTCVSGVPDETTFSRNQETPCNRDDTKEVMPADNESVKALDSAQMIHNVTQEVVYQGTERNSKFDDSVILDSHNIDGLVAKVKIPEISDVTEDSEEKYENESAYGGTTKEVVSADKEPFEEIDIAQILPPVMEEVIEGIEKSSNLDKSGSPDLQNTDGQVAEDKFFNESFGNANKESEEKSEAFDIVQILPTAVEVHECIEKGSNWDDSVLPDLPNIDGQVSEGKSSNEITVNAPEEFEETYKPKSSNCDRNSTMVAKRITDELEPGMMPVVLKSNGDAQHSSSCEVSYSSDEYEQGDLNCSEGDKYNLKEKDLVAEDLGNECLHVNAAFQEDEESKEGACKIDKIMDAMHDLSMDKNAPSKEHSEELLDIQKGISISVEKVDESLDTGVCCCEDENHIINSEETKEILDLHDIGSLITCSADSTKPCMLKPEVGDDSPVTASNHGKCSLHEENKTLEFKAISPISNSFGMKRLFRDDQSSGFKESGLEMSKSNSKSEYIEHMKNAKQRIDNSQDVIEELHHQEHKVMGQVVEPKFTQEISNQCHIGSALMDTDVCAPSIWDDSEVKPCTDNTWAKSQKCSGGAIASVLNVFPSFGDLCGLKASSKAGSENAKEKVSTNACLVGQPADNLSILEDLQAHTTIGDVMLIKQEADANYVGPNTVSPVVVESSKNNMAAQFAGFEVSNLRSNEASTSMDSALNDQSICNPGNDVLVYGNNDNNVVADKVNTGSIEAITGIKNVSDGVESVEKNAQRLDGDSLSGKRNSAYVESFSHISRRRTESDSPLSFQKVSPSCGVLEKRHLSVQEGYDSIGLKPGRVSGLKFKDAGKDGIIDIPVSDSRHDQTESDALENIASPLVNGLGLNWLFGIEVHNLDPDMSNATSSGEDVKKGSGGVAIPQYGAGKLSEHKHQAIEGFVKLSSTQELELDSIKGRALEADLKKSIAGVSTTPIRKKKQGDIFVPKTPNNLLDMSDMKENFNARKSEQVTNITSGKPLRNRRALEDLQNK